MAVIPRKKKAAAKKATKKATAKKKAAPPSAAYQEYLKEKQELFVLIGRLASHVRPTILVHQEIARVGYRVWRVMLQPGVRARVEEELKPRNYTGLDAKIFVAHLLDEAPHIEPQFVRPIRYMLLSAFQRLDYLIASRQWRVSGIPTAEQIEAKLREMGGSDPEKMLANIHRAWVTQKTLTKQQQIDQQDAEEARRLNITVEELKEFHKKQRASRQRDALYGRMEQFVETLLNDGEVVERCDTDGMFVRKGGKMVKLTLEQLEALTLWHDRQTSRQKPREQRKAEQRQRKNQRERDRQRRAHQ